MKFIDTHNHLYLEEFDADRFEVVERAKNIGIQKIMLPNIDSGTIERLKNTQAEFEDFVVPMMGLHPTSVKENYEHELEIVEKELAKGGYVAIGEIGIDLYWDKTFAEEQKKVLRRQFELALQYDLPVVIHMRDSYDEIMEVCNEFTNSALRGVFHCFTGSKEQAEQITSMGFYLGIGGVLTFKNSGLDKALAGIDLKNIVLETDAPYLAPVPYRGKRNEAAFMIKTAEKLALIHDKTLEEIAEITTANAVKLFGIS